jgi:hypothetical protein
MKTQEPRKPGKARGTDDAEIWDLRRQQRAAASRSGWFFHTDNSYRSLKMKDEKLLSRFMRDTAHHNVIIERDEGVYRHLIFKSPGTNSYRFDIITWPGYLTSPATWVRGRSHASGT